MKPPNTRKPSKADRNDAQKRRQYQKAERIVAETIKEPEDKSLTKRQKNAELVDHLIRNGFTRQVAVRVADKYYPRQIPKARQINPTVLSSNTDVFTNKGQNSEESGAFGGAEPREVQVRQGQGRFRQQVLDAYGGRCAVTGCDILVLLDAAHIIEFHKEKRHEVTNGICLRVDIHRLFDKGLLTLNSNGVIDVSEKLKETEYYKLRGQKITLPALHKHRPNLT